VDHIITKSRRNKAERLKSARNRIRAWQKTQAFRDAIWDTAVIQLDLDSPAILAGVSRKARAGRIDAARLALEVTGRHDPKGDAEPTQIEVLFTGIPRPQREHRSADVDEDVEDAEYEELDDDGS
jgi:hypothetical protein